MLTVHHLNYSRSTRILWLLEELGVPYDLKTYERGPDFRAPPALKAIHPSGKSPVITDGDLTLGESATILRYIHDRHGNGRLTPPVGTTDAAIHDEWFEGVESSGGPPVLVAIVGRMTGQTEGGLADFFAPEFAHVLDHIDARVRDRGFLMGERPMLADIQMSYLLAMARAAGGFDGRPALAAYYDRPLAQPAYRAAEAKGGPMWPQDMN